MLRRLLFSLPAMLTALVVPVCGSVAPAAEAQAVFYVAPDGNDDNPGTEAQPLATVDRARRAVRGVARPLRGDVVVVLRGNTYRIDRTLVFEPDDSGDNGHNIIYRAAAGETATISGGKPVAGWQADTGGRWKAPAPVGDFRQLYINGVRAVRARGPQPEGIEPLGKDGYRTTSVKMADWKNPSDLEFCYLAAWTHTRCKVQSIRREGDRAIIAMLQPHFTYASTKEGANLASINRMYVENALELLDEPGEWYLDHPAKTIYYQPRPGEDMAAAKAVVPAVEKLVELRGTLDRPVHHIQFQGITFAHGSWLLPNKIGMVDVQANFLLDPAKPFTRQGKLTTVHNENLKSPSSVVCRAVKSIRFERCTFTALGGGGIDIEYGAQDNAIVGCRFHDISGSAVQIGDVLKDDHHPDDPRKIVKNNSVLNSYIHDCCVEYMDGVGVFAGYTQGTRIAHNEITRLPYSGISIGWGWGEEDAGGGGYEQPFRYDTPTTAKDNRIEHNHIHHVMQTLYDGGGVYTLGNMPGTQIRDNHIHDNPGEPGGVYLDEGSGFIEVAGNVVYGVKTPMNYNNRAQNRKDTCKEHDNFFGQPPTAAGAKRVVEAAGIEPPFRDLLKPRP